MQQLTRPISRPELHSLGIRNPGAVYRNLSTAALYEQSIRRREGLVAEYGPLVVRTGQFTGRSPKDKFIVRELSSEEDVWWGTVNQPMPPAAFTALQRRLSAYMQGRDLFVQDMTVGADPRFQVPIRIVTDLAWHALFSRNLFIKPSATRGSNGASGLPPFVILDAAGFHADPAIDETHSDVFVVLNFAERMVLIGGTAYAGEIKKSMFTVMNYLLPRARVLPMHCSANVGKGGDVALFFGLSGTGKTTLSADSRRTLIGDDEHGWSDRGIFNFEGGCYAKVIRLSPRAEPEIFATTRRFGTVLENVLIDPETRELDLESEAITENTRAAYPIEMIPNADLGGVAGHPSNIIFLTADAFGVMPPISRLTLDQAMYHFLAGYTAKVAGTERGVTEPEATFSACFGAPFLVLPPNVYAQLLGEMIARHQTAVWLINTGWSGGPHGVGKRIDINHTRAMVSAAVSGKLTGVETRVDPVFGLRVPVRCPGVPDDVLWPRDTWNDPASYDAQATRLAGMFQKNFEQFASQVSAEIVAAGPNTR